MSQTKTQLVEGLSINTSAPADALAIGDNGEFGIAGNNYGTSGQVLTSQGSGSAPQWSTIASDAITEGNTSAEVVDTGSDGHFKVITEGTEALRVDSSQRVGIGTSGPTIDSGNGIHIHNSTESAIHFTNSSSGTTSTDGAYIGYNSNALLLKNTELGATIRFQTYDSERARIDGSGRLLVGTSSARSPFSATPLIQVEGTTYATSSISITQNSHDSNSANFYLAKSRGGSLGSHAVISNNDEIGSIDFAGADGSQMVRAARIQCLSDGTPGANDMPGRVVFSTTADGASSPTERLRITNDGTIQLRNSPGIDFSQIQTNAAGATSEILDSYEEGSWTPVLRGSTGTAGSWAASIQTGHYVKIGQSVFLTGYTTLSNKGSYSGTVYVSGFPFNVWNNSGSYGCGNAFSQNFTGVADAVLTWYPQPNTDFAYVFYKSINDGTCSTLDYSFVTNTSQFGAFSIFYPVAP